MTRPVVALPGCCQLVPPVHGAHVSVETSTATSNATPSATPSANYFAHGRTVR